MYLEALNLKPCTWTPWRPQTLYLEALEASNPVPGRPGDFKPCTWRPWRPQTLYLEALEASNPVPGDPGGLKPCTWRPKASKLSLPNSSLKIQVFTNLLSYHPPRRV